MRITTTTALTLCLLYSNSFLTIAQTVPTVPVPNRHHPLKVAQGSLFTDTLVIPGQRVGSVTSKTTLQDLIKLFGKPRLVNRTVSGPEGEGTFSVTQVNLSHEKSLTVVWSDATRTKAVSVRDLGTAWKTPQGIGKGTTLAELRKQLGEFELYGLAWDYGGIVSLKGTRLSRYWGKLILTVAADPTAANRFREDYQAVSGDNTFYSTNPHWQPLGIRVESMNVLLQ